jgi:hypothetical protein
MKSGNLNFLEPSASLQAIVKSGNFYMPSDYLISTMVDVRCECMFYVTSRRKPHTNSHPISVSEGHFCRTPLFKIRPKGIREWNVLLIQLWGYAFLSEVMTIFGNASDSGLRPMTSPNQGFSRYITRGVGSLAGHSWSSLAAGFAARLHLKIHLCARSLSTSRTYKIAKGCIASIITTAQYIN